MAWQKIVSREGNETVENDIDGKKTSHVVVKDEISYAFMCMITLAHFRTARNKLSWLP